MSKEYKLEVENVGTQIKFLASLQGYTMKKLKEIVNNSFGKTDSVRNLNNKFKNKTFRVSELAEISEILGYEIILRKI
ncbi:MAG: hypothetical protein WCY19_05190 [Candidatus Gastranaerophilaceae bacterium]